MHNSITVYFHRFILLFIFICASLGVSLLLCFVALGLTQYNIATIMLDPSAICSLFVLLRFFLTSSVQLMMNLSASWLFFISSSKIVHMASKSSLYKYSWAFAPHLKKSFCTFSRPFVYIWTWTLNCSEKPVQGVRVSKLRFLHMTVVTWQWNVYNLIGFINIW